MSNPIQTQPSSLRVFVQWSEQTVFAGEDIECQITFKNVATPPSQSRTTLHPSNANGSASRAGAQGKAPTASVKSPSPLSPRPHPAPQGRGHRSALSLSVPAGSLRSQPVSTSWGSGHPSRAAREGGQHKRSVSIISIGASEGGVDDSSVRSGFMERPRGVTRGHGRSASLQIIPRRHGVSGGPVSGIILFSMRRGHF